MEINSDPITSVDAVTSRVDSSVLDSAYRDVTAAPMMAKASSTPTPKPKVSAPDSEKELTILGGFRWSLNLETEYDIDSREELLLLKWGKWSPSVIDFREITGIKKTPSPRGLMSFLGMILDRKPGSIKRLNFWTHSSEDILGISGFMLTANPLNNQNYIHKGCALGAVTWDVSWNISDVLAEKTTAISGSNIKDLMSDYKDFKFPGIKQGLAEVRARFASDAVLVVYGCNAGAGNGDLLQSLSNLLKVRVIGFMNKIAYCPPRQTTSEFIRKGMKVAIGDCSNNPTTDWRSLIDVSSEIKTFEPKQD